MIVKPQTFKKGGRYPTAVARAEYLERDGRAVELATQNVSDEEGWAAEMDRTTRQHGLRGSVVGWEYVLSPSPDDQATAEQVRDFGLEWTAENFPNSEAAVVVHVDSKERLAAGKEPIPHAHVYVSAVDLETGRKTQISNEKVRELHDSAQRMSAERGWSAQERYWDEGVQRVRTIESGRTAFERRPQWQRSARLEQDVEASRGRASERLSETVREVREFESSKAASGGVDLHEYQRAKAGDELEKTRVRRAVKEASREVGESRGATLKDALGKRGVEMEHAADGDFKYRLSGGRLEFKGRTLSPRYGKEALRAGIEISRGLARVAEESVDQGR